MLFQDIPYKFMVAVLIEYIRSLNQFAIPVQVSLQMCTASISGNHYGGQPL
jgi:hypothetical protein